MSFCVSSIKDGTAAECLRHSEATDPGGYTTGYTPVFVTWPHQSAQYLGVSLGSLDWNALLVGIFQ